jgi:hypothetical protein
LSVPRCPEEISQIERAAGAEKRSVLRGEGGGRRGSIAPDVGFDVVPVASEEGNGLFLAYADHVELVASVAYGGRREVGRPLADDPCTVWWIGRLGVQNTHRIAAVGVQPADAAEWLAAGPMPEQQ